MVWDTLWSQDHNTTVLRRGCGQGRPTGAALAGVLVTATKGYESGFDKLSLAFDAFAFLRATGKLPAFGKIVHGRRYSAVRVPLGKL